MVLGAVLWGLLTASSPSMARVQDKGEDSRSETPAKTSRIRAQEQPTYLNNGFYIRFKEGESPKCIPYQSFMEIQQVPVLKSMQEIYGLRPILPSMKVGNNPVLKRTFYLEFDSTSRMEQLMEELEKCKEIEKVERVPMYYIQSVPSTPTPELLSPTEELLWNPSSSNRPEALLSQENEVYQPLSEDPTTDPFYGTIDGNNLSWHLDLINAEEAWNLQTASADVVVAVVDNAVWGEHPDLQIPSEHQYNIQSGETGNSAPPSSVDQDPGCDNLVNCYAYNWSHGTHCAGAIGAIRNNGEGIAAIGSGVSVMGVSCPGSASSSGLEVRNGFAGITWAAEHGARVINVSWGGYSISETEREVVQACIDQGIIIVAAAGNDGYKDAPFYPANLPGVISVGSCNSDRSLSSFSNYGNWVTLASPGGFVVANGKEGVNCILSTTYCTSQSYRLSGIRSVNGKYYDGMYGTSMATPVVSGLCGLLLSADPELGPYEMREILMATAQKVDESNGKYIRQGSGIIDAAAALKAVKNPVPAPVNLQLDRKGWTVQLTWEAPKSDKKETGMVENYLIYRNYELIGESQDLKFTDTLASNGLYQYGVSAVYVSDTSLRSCRDIYVPVLYTVDVTFRPENCGSVTGAGVYEKDQSIQLTATAVKGCSFSRWMEDNKVLGRDSVLEYEVGYDVELTAVFTGTPDPSALETFLPVEDRIKVYPNPTRGEVWVETESGSLMRIEIYSVSGILVKEISCREGSTSTRIDMGRLTPGTYILKAMTSHGIQVCKVNRL